jgi:Asp-tRNA(Asn)/Glu-tRNA(Gln) amidotransferase A subunit family amidase
MLVIFLSTFNRGRSQMIVETLEQLAQQLEAGTTTSRDLTEACLARIEDQEWRRLARVSDG